MRFSKTLAAFAFLLSGPLLVAEASTARLIPFQARLTDASGATVADGVYSLTFNLYDTDTGGESCWSETHATVSVVGGVVNVILGALDSLDQVNFNPEVGSNCTPTPQASCDCQGRGLRYLGITIGNGPEEMVPRHQLMPAFHARRADRADSAGISDAVRVGGVTTDMLADAAVTTAKIGNSQITTQKLGPSAVTSEKLADGSISGSKLDPAFQIPLTAIPNESITSAKIQNGTVQGADIAAGTVTDDEIGPNIYSVCATTSSDLTLVRTTPGNTRIENGLVFNLDLWDPSGMHDQATADLNKRLVAKRDGLYLITVGPVAWNNNDIVTHNLYLYKTSLSNVRTRIGWSGTTRNTSDAGGRQIQHGITMVEVLSANEYIDATVDYEAFNTRAIEQDIRFCLTLLRGLAPTAGGAP